MKYVFSSILKDVISGFLKEKRSLGFDYKTEERYYEISINWHYL